MGKYGKIHKINSLGENLRQHQRWIKHHHIQTCLPVILPHSSPHPPQASELSLPDGDFIELVHYGEPREHIALVLHGLEGNYRSNGVQHLVTGLVDADWHVIIMQYRSCGTQLNRLPETYNAIETKDLAFTHQHIQQQHPHATIVAIGFSLGSNLLLHYIRRNTNHQLACAIGISTPFELGLSSRQLPKFYEKHLLYKLKTKLRKKLQNGYDLPFSQDTLNQVQTMWDFDDQITAPLYGYSGAQEYYELASSRELLQHLDTPTLLINSLDDPFVPPASLPEEHELAPCVELYLTQTGGHLGFSANEKLWNREYWPQKLIVNYCQSIR